MSFEAAVRRAHAAGYEAFPFRDAYNEEDVTPAIDAAVYSLLNDLLDIPVFDPPSCGLLHVNWSHLVDLQRELRERR